MFTQGSHELIGAHVFPAHVRFDNIARADKEGRRANRQPTRKTASLGNKGNEIFKNKLLHSIRLMLSINKAAVSIYACLHIVYISFTSCICFQAGRRSLIIYAEHIMHSGHS